MRTLFLCLLSGLTGSAGASWAQLPDPTRPPAVELAPAPTVPGAAADAAAPAGVQAVFVRPGGKSGAVIDGQYVEVGGSVGERRVLKISETEVVLRNGSALEYLRVTPAAGKTRPAVEAAPAPRKKAKGGAS